MILMNQCYQIRIDDVLHYVYEGECDGIPTKWITKTLWNFNIRVRMKNGKIQYSDDTDNEILVFEEDEYEYHLV